MKGKYKGKREIGVRRNPKEVGRPRKIGVAAGYGPRHAENAKEGLPFEASAKKGDLTAVSTDTVPAMLTPREAVLNRNAAELAGRGAIEQLNEQGNLLARKGVDLAAKGDEDVEAAFKGPGRPLTSGELEKEPEFLRDIIRSIPWRGREGPQFSPRDVPIFQGPYGHEFDPRFGRGDLRMMAQAGTGDVNPRNLPGRLNDLYRLATDPLAIYRAFIDQFRRKAATPQPAPAEKRKYSAESFPRGDEIIPALKDPPVLQSNWRDYMHALQQREPKPDEMKGYLDMLKERPGSRFSGLVVNPELLDLQQASGELQKGTKNVKTKPKQTKPKPVAAAAAAPVRQSGVGRFRGMPSGSFYPPGMGPPRPPAFQGGVQDVQGPIGAPPIGQNVYGPPVALSSPDVLKYLQEAGKKQGLSEGQISGLMKAFQGFGQGYNEFTGGAGSAAGWVVTTRIT